MANIKKQIAIIFILVLFLASSFLLSGCDMGTTLPFLFANYEVTVYSCTSEGLDLEGVFGKVSIEENVSIAGQDSMEVLTGKAVVLTATPDPVYNFVGWYFDEACTDFVSNERIYEFTIGSDVTFYALFEPIQSYTVTFMTTEEYATSVTNNENSILTMPENPTKTGYSFAGWNTLSDGSGSTVTQSTIITQNTTVYATWTPNSYLVVTYSYTSDSYGDTGGTVKSYLESVNADANDVHYYLFLETATVIATANFDYSFIGWYTQGNGGSLVSPSATHSFVVLSRKDLYAKFDVTTYNIVYSANGATNTQMINDALHYNDSITLKENTYTRTGYTFLGWATTPQGQVVYSNEAVFTLTSRENIILYAVWQANSYTISFVANGGTGNMVNQTVNYDQMTTLNANTFTRTGYTFAGWAYTPNGAPIYVDQAQIQFAQTINLTLYAIWILN